MRDLMWGMTLLAMGAAWLADHRRQDALLAQQKSASAQAAVEVQIEWLRRYRGESETR
jgi:hypothetical protein